MHFFFWVCRSTVVPVTDWVDRWDETMAASIFFSQLWDTGTPIFSGATTISPSPTLLPFPLQLSYSKTAIYIPPVKSVKVKTASQPTNQSNTQLQRMYCSSFNWCMETGTWKTSNQNLFLFSYGSLLPPRYCSVLASTFLKLPLPATPNKVAGGLTTPRNKQTLQWHRHTRTHLKLGQLGF